MNGPDEQCAAGGHTIIMPSNEIIYINLTRTSEGSETKAGKSCVQVGTCTTGHMVLPGGGIASHAVE